MRARFLALAAALVACLAGMPVRAGGTNPHNAGPCGGCHRDTPRFGIDSRASVNFTGAGPDDPAMCLPCHKAEDILHPTLVEPGAKGTKKSLYLPVGTSPGLRGLVVCTSCHFIHSTDAGYSLLRGFPGTPDPRVFSSWNDFCLECHDQKLVTVRPHKEGPESCKYCHPVRPKKGQEVSVARGSEVCTFCHSVEVRPHYDGANPFGAYPKCLTCHAPHATDAATAGLNEAYLAKLEGDGVTIRPHFRKALCTACHLNLDDYALRDEDLNVMCNRCHASGQIAGNIHPLRAVPSSITPPKGWPLAGGRLTCLTCHYWGHEDQPHTYKMLRGGPYASQRDACRNCHDPSQFVVTDIHNDINEGRRCEFCHTGKPVPGKDKGSSVGFLVEPNLPCLSCHDEPHPSLNSHFRTLSESRAASIPRELPLFKGDRVICGTCHNPHQQERADHKLRNLTPTNGICPNCHLL